MDYFLEIFGGVTRAGPGSQASTRRAYALMTDLPAAPRILDIGCGPGVQTVDLLQLSGGEVVALDLLPLMLERTCHNAEQAGVAGRLRLLQQDMRLLALKANEWAAIPEGMAVIAEARNEIAIFRQYSRYYSYAFFVMQKPAGV